MTPTAEALLELARLALALGRTERITKDAEGHPESVAAHSAMLGWCACSIAVKFFPRMDVGLVAQFALAHDAVEAICGDTQTLKISAEERAAKAERENLAHEAMRAGLASLPWLPDTIADYEDGKAGEIPEAMLVNVVDKWMPRLTHIGNRGSVLREIGVERREVAAVLEAQREIAEGLPTYGNDRHYFLEIERVLSAATLALVPEPKP